MKSARNVTVLTNDIILKDTVVSGNLTLGSDVTSIKLENTKVKGNTVKRNADAKVIEDFQWKDGSFEGIAEGQNGPIRVQIKVEEGKIKDIKILEHKENEDSLKKMKRVLKQIVETGNLDNVELGTDKTINSKGFLNAIRDAVSQSSGETKKPGESKASQEYRNLKDGKYEGVAQGYGGPMRLEIKIKDGKITDIKILKHNETDSYLRATERMLKKIVEQGDINKVDAVSGATISSKAILNAVRDAMSQASGRTEKAGETKAAIENNGGSGSRRGNKATEPKKTDFSGVILPNGDYDGKATGYGGTISVSVKVANNKIAKVTINSHSETGSYFRKAEKLLDTIVEKNSTNIDTISGATITSKGILAAVENALSDFIGKEKKEYADGIWYGQGRGYYSGDRYDYGEWKTATEVKVDIKNGKIVDIELIYHGDDGGYKRPAGYELIEKRIIKYNSTEGLAELFANKPRNEPIYDAVSGATNSARGFVNAINDALNRSSKFKKDGISQEVRSITLNKRAAMNINFGEELNLENLVVNVKYLDGHEEDVSFADLGGKGIECNLPMVFTPEPKDTNKYNEYRDYELTFIHKKSTSKHTSGLQASRKIVYKGISKILIETNDGESYTVPITPDDFRYTVDLKAGEFKEIKDVQVLDTDQQSVVVKSFEVLAYNKPMLSVELKELETQPTDKISESYRFNTYQIEFNVNAEFDKEKIVSFYIETKPGKLEYFKDEDLDLQGLTIIARDSNYVKQKVDFSKLQEYGFIVSPLDGSKLNEKGDIPVTIKYNNGEIPEQSFNVTVKEKGDIPRKIILQSTEGEIVHTINLKDGTTVYFDIKLPAKYKTDSPVIKVYSEKEEEIIPHKTNFKPGSNILQVYFTEDTYAFLSIDYED